MKSYKGDGSLITACRRVLEFQKQEAESKVGPSIDYLLKLEEFDKIKKAYETKPANQRTKADVDQYNKAVSEINAEIDKFNKENGALYQTRVKVYNDWDSARKRFLSAHIPNG